MCGGGGPSPMPTPQQIQPRQPDLVRASRLPESRDVVDPDDVEMLEDLIVAAVNEARHQAQELMTQEMSKLTGGVKIPGLM